MECIKYRQHINKLDAQQLQIKNKKQVAAPQRTDVQLHYITRTGQAIDQCLFWFISFKCNFLSIQLQQQASFVTTSLSSLLFKTVTFVHLF
jgi:hypothetical protein